MKKVFFASVVLFTGITSAYAQMQNPEKKQDKAEMLLEQMKRPST